MYTILFGVLNEFNDEICWNLYFRIVFDIPVIFKNGCEQKDYFVLNIYYNFTYKTVILKRLEEKIIIILKLKIFENGTLIVENILNQSKWSNLFLVSSNIISWYSILSRIIFFALQKYQIITVDAFNYLDAWKYVGSWNLTRA